MAVGLAYPARIAGILRPMRVRYRTRERPGAEGTCAGVQEGPADELVSRYGGAQNRVTFSFLEGIEDPVAWGTMLHLPDQPIVELGGAATVSEQRGKRIYTSLVAHRLRDARERGAEAAVIQAAQTTSAPVCRKLGFIELCGLETYAWIPEEAKAHLGGQWGF